MKPEYTIERLEVFESSSMLRSVLLLLLLPGLALSQDRLTLGTKPDQTVIEAARKAVEQGDKARGILNLNKEPIVRQIEVGGYFPFDLGSDGQLWLVDGVPFDPAKDYPFKRIDLKAGQTYGMVVLNAVAGTADINNVTPSTKNGGILFGRKVGHTVITVLINGDAGPMISNTVDITVGKPAPPIPPEPPVPTDTLAKAAHDDIAAGRGTADELETYQAIMKIASQEVQTNQTFKTVGDVYTRTKTAIEASFGPATGKFSGLRTAVQKELDGKISTNPSGPLTEPTRKIISAAFKSISDRLEGVK